MIGPLRLDYDGRRPPKLTRAAWLLGRAGYRLDWWSECRSPGGKGWHVEAGLRPRPRTCVELVALQAVLGSDPAREACNVTRARMVDRRAVSPWWARRWNVLYVG